MLKKRNMRKLRTMVVIGVDVENDEDVKNGEGEEDVADGGYLNRD